MRFTQKVERESPTVPDHARAENRPHAAILLFIWNEEADEIAWLLLLNTTEEDIDGYVYPDIEK